jgi:hypothetical protein
MKSPYEHLPARNFWRSGVCESDPQTIEGLYEKKFAISATDKVATGGSCFAQRVANFMRASGFKVMDVEPPPPSLPPDVAKSFGYNIYSARYGNIYTVRQLLQLAQDAESGTVDAANIWEKDGRFYDALRPNVEPDGFESAEEALALRRDHLARVKRLFGEMDVFIFTFGLTEAWLDRKSGRVFPTAPGTIAGEYDPEVFEFRNFGFNDIYDDFVAFQDLVRKNNPDLRIILTVSPVPMTATATDKHVLIANTYLKSLLRTVAGALSDNFAHIDYFPGYEMVATPFSKAAFYEDNMRLVSQEGLTAVMRIFFGQHGEHRDPKDKKATAQATRIAVKKPAQTQKPAASAPSNEEDVVARRTARREARFGKEGDPEREARRARKAQRLAAQQPQTGESKDITEEEAVCEDLLLDAFAPN